MTKFEIEIYTALKISMCDKVLKNNILDALIMFETDETKKRTVKTI